MSVGRGMYYELESPPLYKKAMGLDEPLDLSAVATHRTESHCCIDAILAGYESDSSLIKVVETDYDE